MQYHVTNTGERMFIQAMEDSHLINTINKHLRAINASKAIIDTSQTQSIEMIAAGVSAELKRRASERIKDTLEILPPYIMEACIRGIDVRESLTSALGRDSMLLIGSKTKALPPLECDDCDDCDDYDDSPCDKYCY